MRKILFFTRAPVRQRYNGGTVRDSAPQRNPEKRPARFAAGGEATAVRQWSFMILFFCVVLFHNVGAEVLSRELELMTGYGTGHLAVEVQSHVIIPVIARALWEVKPGGYLGGSVFVAPIIKPAQEMEAGCGILWQQRYRKYESVSPYLEVEGGLLYSSLKTKEQATQYNFIFQTGIGTYISLNEDLKLDIGYRFRHYSNSAIELPNIGVNHHMLLVGLCWEF